MASKGRGKKNQVDKNCIQCGKHYTIKKCKESISFYCSNDCKFLARRLGTHPKNLIHSQCMNYFCQKKFTRYITQYVANSKTNLHFCSNKCKFDYRTINYKEKIRILTNLNTIKKDVSLKDKPLKKFFILR